YAPTEQELQAVRFEFDPAPPLETLMMHFCGEMRLTQWYRRASEWHTEPVIKHIYTLISQDEARHGGCYRKYMERAIQKQGNVARMAFARMGVLMASIRTSNALHPTNLHVNKKLFPKDTVQSRLPEPGWVERWLNNQIDFNLDWQKRVIERIMTSLSTLLQEKFESVRDLQLYRKTLAAQMA
ncbi:MAG: ferritin-like domain-containing protein, partial [Gammaproteobacteria bacterium]